METNYYEVLEVSPSATQKQIKEAFGSLAMTRHPDKNPDKNPDLHLDKHPDKGGDINKWNAMLDKWREINSKWGEIKAAYNVLKDPTKRRAYDNRKQKEKAEVPFTYSQVPERKEAEEELFTYPRVSERGVGGGGGGGGGGGVAQVRRRVSSRLGTEFPGELHLLRAGTRRRTPMSTAGGRPQKRGREGEARSGASEQKTEWEIPIAAGPALSSRAMEPMEVPFVFPRVFAAPTPSARVEFVSPPTPPTPPTPPSPLIPVTEAPFLFPRVSAAASAPPSPLIPVTEALFLFPRVSAVPTRPARVESVIPPTPPSPPSPLISVTSTATPPPRTTKPSIAAAAARRTIKDLTEALAALEASDLSPAEKAAARRPLIDDLKALGYF